jgi:ApbE superfamily uncharacterized protein (UPF0280 family)
MEPRIYRNWSEDRDLISFTVIVKETDLFIRANANLQDAARQLVTRYRQQIQSYIRQYPLFLTAMEPLPVNREAPDIVRDMIQAGQKAGVGPMAAVAGAIAEYVGRELLALSPEIIVENGGDLYLSLLKTRKIGIFAGKSPLTGKIGLEVAPESTPLGICTSSGTVGPSISFGKADAAVAVSPSAILADAAATAIGNRVKQAGDIGSALEFSRGIEGLTGALVIVGEKLGAWGSIKLCETAV